MFVNKSKIGFCDLCQDYGAVTPEILGDDEDEKITWVCGQCLGEIGDEEDSSDA